jgi:hypothetical protein
MTQMGESQLANRALPSLAIRSHPFRPGLTAPATFPR